MRSALYRAGLTSIFVALLMAVLFWFRIPAALQIAGLLGAPELTDRDEVVLGENERWIDDYYTVEQIDERTFAISEARYFRDVYMYLLIGGERALLIGTGSPIRDPKPIVSQLTDKPVTVLASHLHFDHTGNLDGFPRILMQDTPAVRAQIHDGRFIPTHDQFLGAIEGFAMQSWPVNDWWKPGTTLDLGDRKLELIETPGHTPDSVSVWDKRSDSLYMGDYAGDGEIYAFLPNSSLQSYLDTTQAILGWLPKTATLYAAHGAADHAGVPTSDRHNLTDLAAALKAMRDGTSSGTGVFPRTYPMNHNTVIWTDIPGPNSSIWDFR